MARSDTLPQNTGHPTTDRTHTRWRNSVLVGPQTAGLPTIHNEDESGEGSMAVPPNGHDDTGGAVEYHRSQRRK